MHLNGQTNKQGVENIKDFLMMEAHLYLDSEQSGPTPPWFLKSGPPQLHGGYNIFNVKKWLEHHV